MTLNFQFFGNYKKGIPNSHVPWGSTVIYLLFNGAFTKTSSM